MPSKYDTYWENRLAEIAQLLEAAYENGKSAELDVSDIKNYGKRNNWYGIVEVFKDEIKKGEMAHVRSLGKVIVRNRLLDSFEKPGFRLTVLSNLKLRVEKLDARGESFFTTTPAGELKHEIQKLEKVLNFPLIDNAERLSIKNAIWLYNQGQYLDGLKILFPVIEGILNRMLRELGEQPSKFPGWKRKVDYLENKGVIPSDIARAVEIISSRNKTVHGEFTPPAPEYAYPLFQMAVIYLHRIVSAWAEFKGRTGC